MRVLALLAPVRRAIFPALVALPLSLAATLPTTSLAATLEVEERKVDLLSPLAIPDCAGPLVLPGAKAVTRLQPLNKAVWIYNIVLLEPEPERWRLLGPAAVGALDDALDAPAGEEVVGEVHLLQAGALPDEAREGLGADIV